MRSIENTKIVIYVETGLVGFGLVVTLIFVISTFIVEDWIVQAQPYEEQKGVRLWLGSVFTGIFVLMLGCSLAAAILTSLLKKGYEEKCHTKLKVWLIAHSLLYMTTLIGGVLVILKDPYLLFGSIPTWVLLPYQIWSFCVVNEFRNSIPVDEEDEDEVGEAMELGE